MKILLLALLQIFSMTSRECRAQEPPISFSVYYRAQDPGAAPGISNQFLNQEPIQKQNLYVEFTKRLGAFHDALQNEASQAQVPLNAGLVAIQSFLPAFQQVETTLQATAGRLES